MRRIVVTGANKGIGKAIAHAILERDQDTFVYLGSRDLGRGRAAADELTANHPGRQTRIEVVELDVASDASVAAAASRVAAHASGEALYGLVNNAGVGTGSGLGLAAVLEVNVHGIRRACEAFLPLLDPASGRIVNVTSAAGPSFVASADPETQHFLLDDRHDWPRLQAFIDERVAASADPGKRADADAGDAYGLSKALANTYTRILARQHPNLRINACTPGFIETDMTRHYAESHGKSPAEVGMKPPAAGARAPLHLLFDALDGNGRYYGSDAERSPLDRYRSPGSPPYEGP